MNEHERRWKQQLGRKPPGSAPEPPTPEPVSGMRLSERAAELEASRVAQSRALYGHTGAAIPGTTMDWQAEALALETQLAGAVEALEKIARGHYPGEHGPIEHTAAVLREIAIDALDRIGGQ